MGILVWEECAGAERASIDGIEFFVSEYIGGAMLYYDSSSFDQGYGGSQCASVEDAKDKAEQAARGMYDSLAERFAPLLKWKLFYVRSSQQHVAVMLERWCLQAGEAGWWEVFMLSGGVPAYRADYGRAADGPSARRAAENALRLLGAVFRVIEE